MSQSDRTVIPGEPKDGGRDPWFNTLTTLSEVEGESRKVAENQIILDPPPLSAGITNYDIVSLSPDSVLFIISPCFSSFPATLGHWISLRSMITWRFCAIGVSQIRKMGFLAGHEEFYRF